MYKNYVKVAWRNLWKNKAFSAINIIGLAAGLAVCLLIVLYVFDELHYDQYNSNASRIYRLDADIYFNGTQFTASVAPKPLPPALVRDYPQVEQMVRLNYRESLLVKKGNINVSDHHVVFADSTFFKVFTIRLIQGNPVTVLNEPHSLVIDETTAKKYFNSTDVVGKTLFLDNSDNCKVTGVMQDMPRQSHFHASFIRPFHDTNNDDSGDENDWLSNNDHCYILVKPGVTQAAMQSRVDATINNYLLKQLEGLLHTSPNDLKRQGNYFRYHLMPVTAIHLFSDKSYEMEPNGNVNYVYIFSAVALFILLIACVNFMNLSTARSANRAKEVGIKKVAGSLRTHLIAQFLIESVLISFCALLLALGLAMILMPLFNQLSGKEMHVSTLFSTWLLPLLLALVFFVGCIAGSYPAFYLSSFKPIEVLKGKIAAGFKGGRLRSILVVFQFSISIILIVGTIVIYHQLDYIRSKKIGFNRDQVLVLHDTYNLQHKIASFRQDLLRFPGVQDATMTGNLPTDGSGGFSQNGWFRDPALDAKKVIILTHFTVDEHYIPTLGMQLAAGRNFSSDFKSDSSGILLNESAVRLLGLKDPLNMPMWSPGDNFKPFPYHVIGVVKDFNYNSMHERVGPLVMSLGEDWRTIAVRFHSDHISSLISKVEAQWNSMAPGMPFRYTFMDDDFNNMYFTEVRTGKLFVTFAVFAIFIACLGLFGLVTYAAEQRIKEIGIRKVLGAKVAGIVAMLSKDFAKLVLIAALIGFPVAWWAMNRWLESFAFRIQVSWWVFVIAGLLTITVALLTVTLQAVKAAIANPVKSLRSE